MIMCPLQMAFLYIYNTASNQSCFFVVVVVVVKSKIMVGFAVSNNLIDTKEYIYIF